MRRVPVGRRPDGLPACLPGRAGGRRPAGRVVETAAGMLNAIGLQNIGVERFVGDVVPRLEDAGATFVANIYGKTLEEYEAVARRLSEVPSLGAIEANASCPNR